MLTIGIANLFDDLTYEGELKHQWPFSRIAWREWALMSASTPAGIGMAKTKC
jgi:hypothetical protein